MLQNCIGLSMVLIFITITTSNPYPNTKTSILPNLTTNFTNPDEDLTPIKNAFDKDQLRFSGLSFKDYLEKFDMKKHAERLTKLKQTGKMSSGELFSEFIRSIDPTDDLIKLKVKPGDPKIINETRRQMIYPHKVMNETEAYYDRWNLKPRILALMEHAIFEVRNKMIPMQVYRELFRETALYKMGFLTSKIDFQVQTYSKFAWLSFRMCGIVRQGAANMKFRSIDVIPTIQKQLEMRADITLLIELLEENEFEAMIVLKKFNQERRKKFKFVDDVPAEQI